MLFPLLLPLSSKSEEEEKKRRRISNDENEEKGSGGVERSIVADDFAPTAFASSLGAGPAFAWRGNGAPPLSGAFLDGPRVLTYSVAREPATRGRKTGRARPIPENHRLRGEEEEREKLVPPLPIPGIATEKSFPRASHRGRA